MLICDAGFRLPMPPSNRRKRTTGFFAPQAYKLAAFRMKADMPP